MQVISIEIKNNNFTSLFVNNICFLYIQTVWRGKPLEKKPQKCSKKQQQRHI